MRHRLAAALLTWFAVTRPSLTAERLENVVFRREIGMTTWGRLKPTSPIARAHLLLLGLMALLVPAGLIGGWAGAAWMGGSQLLLIGLAAYPVAFRRAFLALQRERRSGSLEQLYLTRLPLKAIFDGKCQAALAPFEEARPYLWLLGAIVTLAVGRSRGSAYGLLALAGGWSLINHFGFSAGLGVLAGIKAGAAGERPGWALMRQWELNPWPRHAAVMLTTFLIILLPLAFLLFLAGFPVGRAALYPAFALTLAIPFRASIDLANHEAAQRDRLRHQVRSIFSFEPSAA